MCIQDNVEGFMKYYVIISPIESGFHLTPVMDYYPIGLYVRVYGALLCIKYTSLFDTYEHFMQNADVIMWHIRAIRRAQTQKWREIYAYRLGHYICNPDNLLEYCPSNGDNHALHILLR